MADEGARMREHRGTATDNGASPDTELPPVDETVIEQLASITDAQGHSVLTELLNAFLLAVPARLDALETAVTNGDLASVAHQAHSLTGSAASFGARGMADLCRLLRAAADRGEMGTSRALVTAVLDEFARVRSWLIAFGSRT
jgi:HPt (histidine-containing phosphotransfer) domain-containing protein